MAIRTIAQIRTDLGLERESGGKRDDLGPGVSIFTLLRDLIDSLTSIVNTIAESFPALRVGSATDYTDFNADGVQTMVGDARVYKEVWVPFNALKAPGTKPATFKEWGISGVWEFSDATDDTIVFNLAVPLDMDRTVVPAIRLGWSTNTDEITETAVWQLEYLYRALGEDTTVAAQATETVNSDADAQADGLNIAAFPALALPSADDICIHCRVKRMGAAVADDLTDTAELHGVCFMYISDKLGTAL